MGRDSRKGQNTMRVDTFMKCFASAAAISWSAAISVSDPGGGSMPHGCPTGVGCGTPKYGDCSIYPSGAAGCGTSVTVCETMYGPPTGGETDCGNCFTDSRERQQKCMQYGGVASLSCDAVVPGLTKLPCTDSNGACCWSSDVFPNHGAGPTKIWVPFGGFRCCGSSGVQVE